MTMRERVSLAPLTSLGVGGPARFFAECGTEQELRAAAVFARERSLPLRVIGAGTNILVPDAGIEAVVVRLAAREITFAEGPAGTVLATAEAGASWDALVAAAVARGFWGLENLSGIPGTVGGAVEGNIGAYGAALSDMAAWVEVFDLATDTRARISAPECAFGYRTSAFKSARTRVVLSACFALARAGRPNLSYHDLAARFPSPAPELGEIRQAVLAVRGAKFPDCAREGSAGSFWKNLLLPAREARRLAARFPGMPLFDMPEAEDVKVPVAWLLDHILNLNGYARGPVRLFEQQPLVLVAKKGARAADIDALAQEVERRMRDTFGIALAREVETFA